ncbi:hypothetical protein QJS10_CPA01g00545 [Acorus calamus]|uniref:Uncharacterized protein n=1 Tax=Acorus calamus TaxID=4465 RepID=A0AAV9FG74_ACOCL|nr:hypothetical protein QJS10_CPA01g00545 [Acorus calamus]
MNRKGNRGKPPSRSRGGGGGRGGAAKRNRETDDGFFEPVPEKQRRRRTRDEEIASDDDDDDDRAAVAVEAAAAESEEEEEETVAEAKLRLAKARIEEIRQITRRVRGDDGEGSEGEEEAEEEEREGNRDSLIAGVLQREQLEGLGRVRRELTSRVREPETADEFRCLVRHPQSVTAVVLSEDDSRGYSASKDGKIVHWDVESRKSEKYTWPSEEVLVSHYARSPKNQSAKRSKNVLALAVSSDNRYLATGGLDRHVHLWDTRTREHIQAFPGHKEAVSSLAFRLGTSELFSASFDRTIKSWNAEDRASMETIYGHQSDVLTIDCLHKERLLSVGRDRTMRYYNVSSGKHVVFRSSKSSLECCCFISDDQYLSGSDDGSIELWSIKKKKPVFIVKNAHTPPSTSGEHLNANLNGRIPNGDVTENGNYKAESSSAQSWVSSVSVCRGSDLAASGAGNGVVHLWSVESDAISIRPLYDLPLVGFVNSLAFAKSGHFLVAGVGQVPDVHPYHLRYDSDSE